MLIVQDVIISDDIVEQQFLCNLTACKGACCWEGDFGAPLEEEEQLFLDQTYEKIAPYLTPEGKAVIEEKGKYDFFKEMDSPGIGTPLLDNGACAYMIRDELGRAKCGIEKAWEEKAIDFKKPVSCHLYPIRVISDKESGFAAMNYDEWDICSAACTLGQKEQLPLYQFVKDAIIRKFSKDFYDELDAAAHHFLNSKEEE